MDQKKLHELNGLGQENMRELLKGLLLLRSRRCFLLENELREALQDELQYSQILESLDEEYGQGEARKLMKLGLVTYRGIGALQQALGYSSWNILEDLRILPSKAAVLRFGIADCSAEKTMRKWGKELVCREPMLKTLEGFFQAINPGAKVSPLGEETGEYPGYSCAWEVRC